MNRNEGNALYEIDLLKLAKAVWNQVWLVIIAMAVFGAAAFAYAQYMITPMYKASTMIYVNSGELSVDGKISISGGNLSASQNLVSTYLVILNTRGTINQVIRDADLDYTYDQLKSMINASSVDSTAVFKVEVTSSDPKEAELIANSVARVLPNRISEIMEGSSTKVVDYAVIPSARFSPSLTRYFIIGVLVGALLSCGFIAVRELMDDQIRSEKELSERHPDIPVLAAIPNMEKGSSGGYGYSKYGYYRYGYHRYGYEKYGYGKAAPEKGKETDQKNAKKESSVKGTFLCRDMSFSVQEAYKLLRTNLMFSLPDDQKCRIIGVTSALRGDGKSTTALNLAYTTAEAGKRVLLLEGDLRLPNMAKRLTLKKLPGLSNLLANMATLEDAVQPSGLLKTLDVIVAGDVPPNPSELLGSERMAGLLQELSAAYDYIVFDLPPVNAVSDGLVISKLVQGMVLVVRQDYDDYHAVGDAISRMRYLDCKIMGAVLTCAGVNSGRYGYRGKRYGKYGGYKRYGYRYGGGYKNYSYSSYNYSYNNYGYGKAARSDTQKDFQGAVVQPEETEVKQGTGKDD